MAEDKKKLEYPQVDGDGLLTIGVPKNVSKDLDDLNAEIRADMLQGLLPGVSFSGDAWGNLAKKDGVLGVYDDVADGVPMDIRHYTIDIGDTDRAGMAKACSNFVNIMRADEIGFAVDAKLADVAIEGGEATRNGVKLYDMPDLKVDGTFVDKEELGEFSEMLNRCYGGESVVRSPDGGHKPTAVSVTGAAAARSSGRASDG